MLLGLVDRDERLPILAGQENDGFQRAVGDNLLEHLLFTNHLEQILRLNETDVLGLIGQIVLHLLQAVVP